MTQSVVKKEKQEEKKKVKEKAKEKEKEKGGLVSLLAKQPPRLKVSSNVPKRAATNLSENSSSPFAVSHQENNSSSSSRTYATNDVRSLFSTFVCISPLLKFCGLSSSLMTIIALSRLDRF